MERKQKRVKRDKYGYNTLYTQVNYKKKKKKEKEKKGNKSKKPKNKTKRPVLTYSSL